MDDWSTFSNPTNQYQNQYTNQSRFTSHEQSQTVSSQQQFQQAIKMSQPVQDVEPTFQLEKQPDTLDSSTGHAVCFATASNWIIIATQNNNLIRWYIGGDQDEKNMISISTKPDERIFEIFLSPNGKHILISMTNGVLYYVPTNSEVTKAVQIQKFQFIVHSVAWYQYDTTSTNNSIPNPVQNALLGTAAGTLWELVLEDNRDRSIKKLFELTSNSTSNFLTKDAVGSHSTAITGITLLRAGIDEKVRHSSILTPTTGFKDARWHLLFVTSSHEYKLSGGPTIEAMFTNQAILNGQLSFIELPGGLISLNQLTTFATVPGAIGSNVYGEHLTQGLISPNNYGWLTAAGVYYAQIDPNCQPATSTTNTADQFSISERLIEYPKIQDTEAISRRLASGDGLGNRSHYLQPISILLTQFHVIFLFRQHLAIVNLVNGTIVMSCPLPKSTFGTTSKLSVDMVNNSYWLLTDNAVYEIFVSNEGKDIWRLYLSQGDYDNAYQHCTTPHQSKIVSTQHADALFLRNDYIGAAQQYIRSVRTFESVCMKYLLEYQQYSTTRTTTGTSPNGDNTIIDNSQQQRTKNKQPGMPGSLFTPTISTLFGPNGHISDATKFSSLTASTDDNFTSAGLNLSSSNGNNNDNSSLSLLASLVQTNNGNNHIGQPTTNSLSQSSSSLTSDMNQQGSGSSNSYTYLRTMFQVLEKKWSIYSGLKTYLKQMLTRISQTDKTKLTTLSSWVIEISVNTLVSLQTSFFPRSTKSTTNGGILQQQGDVTQDMISLEEQRIQLYQQECTDLEEFIEEYVDCLHPTTTYQLLSSAGRTNECIFYAKLNKHYSYVLDIYVRENLFLEAIEYLRSLRKLKPTSQLDKLKPQLDITFLNPSSSTSINQPTPLSYIFTVEPELVYRIIPPLLQHYPTQIVDLIIETDGLQSIQVLTAMVRSGLQIEFTTSPDTTARTNQIDPSKKLLQSKLTNMGLNNNNNNQKNQKNQNDTTDHDISVGLHNPANIKSIKLRGDNKIINNTNNPQYQYIYQVSRYLVMLITLSLAPAAAHNLYVAILIQLLDSTRLYNYLIAHKHTTYPNRVFALRLALPHVDLLFSSVIELCLQLQRHTLAIRFALRYDIPTAKRILKTLSTSSSTSMNPTMNLAFSDQDSLPTSSSSSSTTTTTTTNTHVINVEQSLWQEYVQLLLSNGLTIAQIIQDIRDWSSSTDSTDLSGSNSNIDDKAQQDDSHNTALLKILPCLPPTTTIADIQSNVIAQLVDFNAQLNQLNIDMNALHLTNTTLKYQLYQLQQQIVTISTAQRCDICSQPVLLSPFIYFRCGHVFHLQCCVNSVIDFFAAFSSPLSTTSTTLTNPTSQNQSLSKKQSIFLRLLNDLNEDLTTTASLSQTAIQEIDQHFCSDEMLDLVSIQSLKTKVLTNSLSQEEELFFIEEYAQQSCCHCGDLMIESIGLQVNSTTSNIDDEMDWSLY